MLEIFEIILTVGLSLTIIIILPAGIILGIVFAVKTNKTSDLTEKNKNKRYMWWSFLSPLLLIVLILTVFFLKGLILGLTMGN